MPQLEEDPNYPGEVVYPQYYTTPYPTHLPNGLANWGNIRLRQQGPEKALYIPRELYEKASSSNDELTEAERTLLLSRGDAVGKAMAYPKSLTLAEKYEAMGWISLDELHAAIRRASGGIDDELFNQVRNHYLEDPELRKAGYARFLAAEENGEEGLYVQMYEPYGFRPLPEILPSPEFPSPRRATPEPPTKDDSSGHYEPTRRDGVHPVTGQRHWPGFLRNNNGFYPLSSKKLFMRDLMWKNGTKQPLSDIDLSDQYHALAAEERAEYEARAEGVRLAAWDQWEQDQLALPRGSKAVPEPLAPEVDLTGRRNGPRRRDGTDLAGNPDWPLLLKLDGTYPLPPEDLLVGDLKRSGKASPPRSGPELQERYDALTPDQKAELETRSELLRQAAWDEWEQGGWENRGVFGGDYPNWERFDSLNVLPAWRKAEASTSSP